MLFSIKELIPHSVLDHLRTSVHTQLKTYNHLQRKQYITYIKRSKRRYVDPGYEARLLSAIQDKFPQYTVREVYLERLSFPEQLQVIRNTKVLIGAHGNGLTHQLFLPDNSLVIELFPKEAYAMDYQLFAELCNLDYYAFSPEKGVVSKSGTYMKMRGNLNEIIGELDTESLLGIIQDFSSKGAETANETSCFP